MLSANSATLFSTLQPNEYKSFNDYINIEPLAEGSSHFIAHEKVKSHSNNPLYQDKWYLLQRPGLFNAQKEKAMAEIHHYFLGYSTDIEILKNNNDYYAASRGINRFKTWRDSCSSIKLQEDETLAFVNDHQIKPIIGLANMCVLARFFSDTDVHSTQFGIQEGTEVCYAFKIDNEKALEFEDKTEEGSKESKNDFEIYLKEETLRKFGSDITETIWFKNEKQVMLKKIAETDFSYIEKILKKYITSTQIESSKSLLTRMLNMKQGDEAELLEALKNLENTDPSSYGVDNIIQKLQACHATLKKAASPLARIGY